GQAPVSWGSLIGRPPPGAGDRVPRTARRDRCECRPPGAVPQGQQPVGCASVWEGEAPAEPSCWLAARPEPRLPTIGQTDALPAGPDPRTRGRPVTTARRPLGARDGVERDRALERLLAHSRPHLPV